MTAALTLLGFSGTASAAITGVQLEAATSASNSVNKSVTATCPAGTQVVGAGAEIRNFSALGRVVMGVVRPNPTLTGVSAEGREAQGGVPGTWDIRAHAVCAPPPPGLQRVAAVSPANSANKSVTATCPNGKRLIGFGADVDGGGGQVAINDLIPGSGLQSVVALALEDQDGTGVAWRVRAYAICAFPIAGLERFVSANGPDSEPKTVIQACPDGKQLLSAGTELAGGGGEILLDDLIPDPRPAQNHALVTALEDADGTTTGWSARAFAICAAKSQRVAQDGPITAPNAFAGCPPGMQLTGPGGDLTDSNGQVLMTEIIPLGTGATQVTAVPHNTGVGPSGNWFVRAYAICAAPLPGLVVVQTTSAADSSSPKGTSAACPAGKRVVGAGGAVQGAGEAMNLAAVVADPALAGVTATGFEDFSGTFNNWNVTAYAVCAAPPPGLQLVSATSDPDSDAKGITAECPSGKNLLGTGASAIDGVGRVRLDDVRPSPALTRTTVTAFEDEFGFNVPWTLTAQAICANP